MTACENKKKEIYTYDAPWVVYAMNWSVRASQKFRLAIGSFIEEYTNKVGASYVAFPTRTNQRASHAQIEVIQLNEEMGKFECTATFDHPYPSTKIIWAPDKVGWRSTPVGGAG